MNKKIKTQYRQGDILIERLDEQEIKGKCAKEKGRVILAHGEVTGHAHEVTDKKASLIRPEKPVSIAGDMDVSGATQLIVKVGRVAKINHEEHGPIPLRVGTYRVTRQREYSPAAILNVAD